MTSEIDVEAGTLTQEWITVYHGSINNATEIRAYGLNVSRLPTWLTRDLAAAQNAIDPRVRADHLLNPAVIEARIPKEDFEFVLAPNERSYSGFNRLLTGSSEIVIRNEAQATLFNQYIIR